MASRFLAPTHQGGAPQRATALDPLLMLQRDMDRLFGNVVRSIAGPDGDGEMVLTPRIDIRETDGAIEIDAELPGLAEQDVEVSVEDDALVIAGETRRERHDEKSGYRLTERQIGRFRRVIRLPFEPDPDQIDARFRNGLLSLHIPQPPHVDRTKRIAVKSDSQSSTQPQQGAATAEKSEAQREPAEA